MEGSLESRKFGEHDGSARVALASRYTHASHKLVRPIDKLILDDELIIDDRH